MRCVAVVPLALLALLASCASTSGGGGSRELQRERIDRLYRPRTPAATLAAVVRAAPRSATSARRPARVGQLTGAAPVGHENQVSHGNQVSYESDGAAATGQDPLHLDQRLPPLPGAGPRPFRHSWQPLAVRVDVGVGTVDAQTSGSHLDDRTEAAFVRARVDAGTGAALHAEFWSSDDQLFEGRFVNDGMTPRSADASLGGVDLFAHVRIDHEWGNLRAPVRIGAFSDWQRLDYRRADLQRDYMAIGARVVVEPTWRFVDGDRGNLELFTAIGGDVGPAFFKETFHNGDDRDTTVRWGYQLGAGLRGHLGALQAEIGYRLNHATFGRIDSELHGNRSCTDLQRQQFFISFGLIY